MTLSHVGKVYDDGTRAVLDLNIDIADGEFLVFVGPSGCGKTTALRMIAGLETVTEGEVRIGDQVVNQVPPRDRDVAMVFQSYALYPHLSVRDNIGFGLQLRKMPKAEVRRRVEDAAKILGLSEYLDRKPRNLSGGQRQRVAMGRAIVRQPRAFLMDEPLSNLDAKLRVQMRAEIARIQRDLSVTTIYVTHDQTEAMTLGHRVAVLKRGVLQQIAPPQTLYDQPTNIFVAGFIGSPAMNFMPATVERAGGGGYLLHVGDTVLTVPDEVAARSSRLADYVGKVVVAGVRPEDMEDASLAPFGGSGGPGETRPEASGGAPAGDGRTIECQAELVEPLGSDLMVHLNLDMPSVAGNEHLSELAGEADLDLGSQDGKASLVARFSPRSAVREGETIQVAIDTSRLHFFDANSGLAIRDEVDAPLAGGQEPREEQEPLVAQQEGNL